MDEKLTNVLTKALYAMNVASRHLFPGKSQADEDEVKKDEDARERASKCELKTPEGAIEALRIIGERLEAKTKRGLVFTDNAPKLVKASIEQLKQFCQPAAGKSG